MIILKKKHEEILKKQTDIAYESGFKAGQNVAIEELQKKVDILKFFLKCNYNKDVARYEAIAKRTKKIRIREKAEKRILELKELELAFK